MQLLWSKHSWLYFEKVLSELFFPNEIFSFREKDNVQFWHLFKKKHTNCYWSNGQWYCLQTLPLIAKVPPSHGLCSFCCLPKIEAIWIGQSTTSPPPSTSSPMFIKGRTVVWPAIMVLVKSSESHSIVKCKAISAISMKTTDIQFVKGILKTKKKVQIGILSDYMLAMYSTWSSILKVS